MIVCVATEKWDLEIMFWKNVAQTSIFLFLVNGMNKFTFVQC